MTLSDLLKQEYNLDLENKKLSSIKNPEFIEVAGKYCSTIYLEDSNLQLYGTDDRINFHGNVSP